MARVSLWDACSGYFFMGALAADLFMVRVGRLKNVHITY